MMQSRNPVQLGLPTTRLSGTPRPKSSTLHRRRFVSYAALAALPALAGITTDAAANGRHVAVTSFAQLSAALAGARPGDEIVLADGEYRGGRLIAANHGTPQNPIVVRAANLLGANVPNGVRLAGRHMLWHGIDMTNAEGANPLLEIGGADNQVWRCRFRAPGDLVVFLSGAGGRFMYNELLNPDPSDNFQANSHLLRGWFNQQTMHYDAEIGYNHIHDFPSKPPDTPYHDYRRFGIAAGSLYRYMFHETNWHIHHNLLENCGSHRLVAYSSGNLFEFNTVIGQAVAGSAASSDFNQRLGWNNVWRGNWAEGTRVGFHIHGGPNKFIGCRIVNGGNAEIFAGNQEYDTLGEGQPRAHGVKLTACDMPVVIGRNWGNLEFPARGTRIEGHNGEVWLNGANQIDTVETSQLTETPVTAIRLVPAMVGPFAAS